MIIYEKTRTLQTYLPKWAIIHATQWILTALGSNGEERGNDTAGQQWQESQVWMKSHQGNLIEVNSERKGQHWSLHLLLIFYWGEKLKASQGDCFHPNTGSSPIILFYLFYFICCCLKPQGSHSLTNPASTSEKLSVWVWPPWKSHPVQ